MTVKVRQLAQPTSITPPTPPPVISMRFIQQPQDTSVNALFLPPPSVQISDGVSDSLTISSPTCDILPVTVTADSTGLALFVGLLAGPIPSNACTLIVHNNTRPSVVNITSVPFALTAVVPVNNLLQDLVSYWKMDESGFGDNAIDSHGSNDLTAVGFPGNTAGIINGSRLFNGFTTYFIRDAPTGLSTLGQSFTFQAWIFSPSLPSVTEVSRGIWAGTDVTQEQEMLLSRFTDSAIFFLYTSDGLVAPGNDVDGPLPAISLNTWHMIHAWYDSAAGIAGVSIDASEIRTLPVTGTPLFNPANRFFVGTLTGPLNLYQGRIDEMGFWRRALTQTDRENLWNGGAGLPYEAFD